MKNILLIIGLIVCETMTSQQIAVFDKENRCYINSTDTCIIPVDQCKIDFLKYFKTDLAESNINQKELLLETPPEWGKKISDSTCGLIKFHEAFTNGFVTDMQLHNLLPGHKYILTLNGNPDLPGNELLPDAVPGLEIEKYLDFLIIESDSNGEYHADIGIFLKKGDYHVRFYVKDSEDFKIVLFHDYFKFKVL